MKDRFIKFITLPSEDFVDQKNKENALMLKNSSRENDENLKRIIKKLEKFEKLQSDNDMISKDYNLMLGDLNKQDKDSKKPEKTNNEEEIDAILIFALSEERTEALKAFGIKDEDCNQEYCLEGNFFYQKFKYNTCNIITVTQSKIGSTMASSLATRAIMCFSPKLIVMTGVCAGRQEKTCIGDVLIASSVYDYTVGKITESRKMVRPDPIQCDDDALNIYTQKIENKADLKFNEELKIRWGNTERPRECSKVHIKALGTGSSVVADKKIIMEAIRTQDDLYGIDMEGYGVALAARQLKIPFFIIKGIQDFADFEKDNTETKDNAREYAAFASAVLASIMIVEKKELSRVKKK